METQSEILFENSNIVAKCIFPILPFPNNQEMREYMESIALLPVQTHSINVKIATNNTDSFNDTDALITFQTGLPIGILTADCVPILVYSSDIKAVAAIHAGWKGTLNGIVNKTAERLIESGANPENMMILFGPSISEARYEVDDDLAKKFADAGYSDCITYPNGSDNRPHINLQKINIKRLLDLGVKLNNIKTNNNCTFETTDIIGNFKYQSYRRDGINSSRILTMITLK